MGISALLMTVGPTVTKYFLSKHGKLIKEQYKVIFIMRFKLFVQFFQNS